MRGGHIIAACVGDSELFTGWRDKAQFWDIGVLHDVKAQCDTHRRFDAGSIHLAVALSCVAVATGKECTGVPDREVGARARRQVADVKVAAIGAWWNSRQATRFLRANTHD